MKIPSEVRRISSLKYKSLITRGLKLTEEVGELAAEILRYHDEKDSKGKTKEEILNAIRLESVDIMLMAMDILAKTGTSDEQVTAIMKLQLERWENWIKNKETV